MAIGVLFVVVLVFASLGQPVICCSVRCQTSEYIHFKNISEGYRQSSTARAWRASRWGKSSNRLHLNPSKTELIWLSSSRRLHHCSGTGMRVSDVELRPVDCVRNLGVLIDNGMTLARPVNYISCVCFFQLRQLRIIRRSLTADAGTRTHTHAYRLLKRASCSLSALSDWQAVLRCGRQTGTAASVPIICVGSHAWAVALVGCGGPGEL